MTAQKITKQELSTLLKNHITLTGNHSVLCLASLNSHPLSYYDTNTRGTILPASAVSYTGPEMTPVVTDANVDLFNNFIVIEELIVDYLAYVQTNPNYCRKCNTKWDFINALRFFKLELFSENKPLYLSMSESGFIDYYYERYVELMEHRPFKEGTVVVTGDPIDRVVGIITLNLRYSSWLKNQK